MSLRSESDQIAVEEEGFEQARCFRRFTEAWTRNGRGDPSPRESFTEGWNAALGRSWQRDRVAVCTVCDRSADDPACSSCTAADCPRLRSAA